MFGSGKKLSLKQNSSVSLLTSAVLIISGLVAMPLVSNATAPVVTSISPTSIGVAGGTITITGTALTGDNVRVFVGGVEASSVVVASDTSVSFSAPSRYNAGFASSNSLSHSVTVVRDTLTSNNDVALSYTGVTSTPTVTAISPSTGTASGGTAITITGSNFLPGRTFVEIGGNPATSIVVDSQDTLRAVTPPTTSASDVSTEVVVRVLDESNGALVATNKPMFAYTITPEVTSVSPSSGTAAGGNVITITGKAFTSATAVRIDGVDVGSFTIVSSTSITATAPVRAAASRTVGRKAVTVEMDGGSLASGTAFYSYRPILIASAASGLPMVTMGSLASRTQAKPITRSTLAPFTVSGTDSTTGQSYTYVTDIAKSVSLRSQWGNEGHEAVNAIWPGKSNNLTGTISTTASYLTRSSLVNLRSSGSCVSDNSVSYGSPAQSFGTYCSVFGPEVYSEAFYGVAGQSLAFDWAAQDNGDDYEIYAYLVAVADATTIPTPSLANHTLLVHGSGKLQSFVTSSGDIADSGLYRFRFVNGSYDASGGKVLGSNMYIDPTITVGQANTISFTAIGDQIRTSAELSSNPTITQTISSSSGAAVVVTSASTNQCTVSTSHSGTTTTVTITLKAHGTCILNATQTASSGFAPAAQVSRAFDIKEAATAPTAPTILSVTPGAGQLAIAFNAPVRDGGAAITNYEYSLDGGSTWAAVSPSATTSPITVTGLLAGSVHQVRIRAVNGVAPGGAQSNVVAATVSSAGVSVLVPNPPAQDNPGQAAPTPAPVPTMQPSPSPRPNPIVRPIPSPPVLARPTPAPSSSPNPVLGPVVMPQLRAQPGVVFSESNPVPERVENVLSSPLAVPSSGSSGPELPAPGASISIAHENGQAVEVRLELTSEGNGFELSGDGWQVVLEALDDSQSPLRLDESGNLILNDDRVVQFSGTGFAPGSPVKVWLFSDPFSLGKVVTDAQGNFVGSSKLPSNVPVGEHTVQLNGLSKDGQVRSVALGVVVQPTALPSPPVGFDLSGLLNILWVLAFGVLIWFFILWRRRKKEDEEQGLVSPDSGFDDSAIFASEGYEPSQQFPNDSRRKIGAAAPPNRKRFTFRPKGA